MDVRVSNIELLRVLSMFMVLVVHTNFAVYGLPNSEIINSEPIISFFKFELQSLSIVCVNLFIFISGWFGMKLSIKGLANLLFQCFFFLFGSYIILLLLGLISFSIKDVASCLMLNSSMWFVKAYLGLYIISPVLNIFIKHSSQKQFKNILLSFFIFQSLYGWLFPGVITFSGGYSTISFIGLYLLARYVRLYPMKMFEMNKKSDLCVYLITSLLISIISFTPLYLNISYAQYIASIQYYYCSPIVVLASLYLFLFFVKLKLDNSFINWIAASSFSVFLLHANDYILPYFVEGVKYINMSFELPMSCMCICVYLLIIFVVSVMIDQLRKLCWNNLYNKIN